MLSFQSRCVCAVITASFLSSFVAPAHAQTVASLVGDNIVRFDASASDAAGALPSIALESPLPTLGPKPVGFPVTPTFSTLGDGRRRVTLDVPPGASIYGTGFVGGPLERTGRRTILWNTDAYGWNENAESLYEAHPWVLVVRADGTSFGALLDTTYRTEIDCSGPSTGEIIVTSSGPSVPVYVIERGSPRDVVISLAEVTGKPFMPPLWALGYHQCRYSYTPASRVLEVASEFRTRQIPADVIWMDIDYMNGYRMFTFNPVTFSNPAALDASLDAIDFRSVAIVDPHIKREAGYFVYDQGTAGNHWVKNSSGVGDYVGPVWPGDSVFVDFTRSSARAWWASLYPSFLATGIDGVWNDMNEPAVFVGSKTMPENNIHRADSALGGNGPHARYHNVYGMQMARATREGMLLARPTLRPFVLTRANYMGGQRYAATWTGDNSADWSHVDMSISNVLNIGLSGQPHVGPDIGGFIGAGSAQQFARWMGIGAMLPFARGHTATGNIDKEPWAFGASVERIARLALQRRYRLLPHIYTLAHEAHEIGLPIARPLFMAEPTNVALRTWDDAFMLGEGVVVAAATSQGATPVRPPMTTPLYRFGFAQSATPGSPSDICEPELPHLYLVGGSIVPSGPIIQSTRDGYLSEVTLLVALDTDGTASGTLYEDAGDGFGYQSGDLLKTTYQAVRGGDTVTVSVATEEGSRARPTRTLRVRLLLADGFEVGASGVDGSEIALQIEPPDSPFDCGDVPPVDPREIDGRYIPPAFRSSEIRATQTQPTSFGDNVSELNRFFAVREPGGIRIGITGNLAQDGTALALFLDSTGGGQETINTSSLDPPPGGLRDLTGTVMDAPFAPDRLLFINTFGGSIYVDMATMTAGASATKTFLGRGSVGSGEGSLSDGQGNQGVLVAMDNSNAAGVTGSSASGAPSATTGFEFFVPDAVLDIGTSGCGRVLALATLVTGDDGRWGNQILPGLPGDWSTTTLGRAPNLAGVAERQYLSIPLGPTADVNGDGVIDVQDFLDFLDSFGSCSGLPGPCAGASGAEADTNGDTTVDILDFLDFLESFGSGC